MPLTASAVEVEIVKTATGNESITSEDGNFKYQIVEDEIWIIKDGGYIRVGIGTYHSEITDYLGSNPNVIIPSMLGGYNVTVFGSNTFYGNTNIQ